MEKRAGIPNRTLGDEWRGRLAGVLAAVAALSAARFIDSMWPAAPSLVRVVGQAFIRATPSGFERFAVGAAGTNDKPIIVWVTVVLALMIGSTVGRRSIRRAVVGEVAFAAFAAFTVFSAAWVGSAPVGATFVTALVSAVVGDAVLRFLLRSYRAPVTTTTDAATPDNGQPTGQYDGPGLSGLSRRRFITEGSVVAGGAALTLAGAWGLRRPEPAAAQRVAVRLPEPAEATLVSDAGLSVPTRGLSPLVTPNKNFFRIDEALVIPSVNIDTWTLRFTGMVDRPFQITYAELLAMPLIERHVTLSCVSNEVGGPLVGTARFLGVRLTDLLTRAGVQAGADQVVGRSLDGFTVGFPVQVATDGRDAMVAIGMNGEPLPRPHGYPARLVVPGLYGYVSATKWLKEIKLTTFDAFDAYWVERNWSAEAPIKVQSRVDVPRDYSRVTAGHRVAAGVAWAPSHGIERVEVQLDDGPWQMADLGPALGNDAWRQWTFPWDASPGTHTLTVRATTKDGVVQTATKHGPFPNGATGDHQVNVRVT